MTKENTKRAYWIMSTKGGVGKTQLSRCLVDYARRNEHPLAVFNADTQVAQLKTIYGKSGDDPYTGVMSLNIRNKTDKGMLVDLLETYNETDMLIDFPGGVVTELEAIVDSIDVLIEAYNAYGYEVVVVIPINTEASSLQSLKTITEYFGNMVSYVIVKNLKDLEVYNIRSNEIPEFKLFEHSDGGKSKSYREILEQGGAFVTAMPALNSDCNEKIDKYALTFQAIKDVRITDSNVLPKEFKIVERSKIGSFISQMDEFVCAPILGV